MNKEDQLKNLLTQVIEKSIFDDKGNKTGESFMTFHLKLIEQLLNEYLEENRSRISANRWIGHMASGSDERCSHRA